MIPLVRDTFMRSRRLFAVREAAAALRDKFFTKYAPEVQCNVGNVF